MATVGATVGDRGRSSSSSSPKRSVHQTLGGGFVADVLLWRNRTAAICLGVGATAFWILFEFVGYSFISLVTNTLLLLVSILFFWAKSAALLNRPLPPIPNLEISNEVIEKRAEKVRVWVNRMLSIAKKIAIERNRKVFLQVILVLWMVSYFGSLFSFCTFVYMGIVLSLTVPVLYDKYEDHINKQLGMARDLLAQYVRDALNKSTKQMNKQKKAE